MKWLSLNKSPRNPPRNYRQRLNRLRLISLLLFFTLFIPASVLSYLGFQQLSKDTLINYQRQTDKITVALNKRLFKRLAYFNAIQKRQFDYYYLVYNPATKALNETLSNLADPSNYESKPGLLGYYQVDMKGRFNSPIWPYTLHSESEKKALTEHLSSTFEARRKQALELQEIVSLSQQFKQFIAGGMKGNSGRFHLFDDVPNYYIFYRVVLLNEQTKLQGFVIERSSYLNYVVSSALNSIPVDIVLAITLHDSKPTPFYNYFIATSDDNGEVTVQRREQDSPQYTQQILGSQTLNWPYGNLTIHYSTATLKHSPQGLYNLVLNIVLLVAMVGSCLGFYKIGVKQLKLAEQRLGFVSSVSHELKTPLTSIRMYAEMLESGQMNSVQDQKDYYNFILSESERLSRLIDNTLTLSKLSQPQQSLKTEFVELPVLKDVIRSKVMSLLQTNGFELNFLGSTSDLRKVKVKVDLDAFSQVVVNIADNSVKFFGASKINDISRKKLDFTFNIDKANSNRIMLEIRDYGPGITSAQEEKLFELFYRGGDELIRIAPGTGIGLALVQELVHAQNGTVKAVSMSQGLALQISLVAYIAHSF